MSTESIKGEAFVLQELFERWSYDIDYYQREFAWSAPVLPRTVRIPRRASRRTVPG
jgi:hypothetical protein